MTLYKNSGKRIGRQAASDSRVPDADIDIYFGYGVHFRSMVRRIQKLSKNDHLFLFGARGTGKSTLIKAIFAKEPILWIDLLTDADEDHYGRHPDELSKSLRTEKFNYVVIDEIQKFPKLLDIVHHEMEKNKNSPVFILTGSSARKLKRSGANLLGGRALIFHLFPFTFQELAKDFNLDDVLRFGSLPLVYNKQNPAIKENYLKGYVKSYLREEILVEQVLRQVEPFKDFLEVAAQMNGEIINFSKISRDVGVSDQTVRSFFQILEDTLIGFQLQSFHRSIRRRQRESPKFYFFDLGVKRALSRTLKIPLVPRSSEYGKAFEHFVILEIYRKCEYLNNDYRLSYLRTKDDAEIDLIIERPGLPDFLLEIKSTTRVQDEDVKTLSAFQRDWGSPVESAVWSLDSNSKIVKDVVCHHWRKGFEILFKN